MKSGSHLMATLLIGALFIFPFATQEASAHGLGDAWVQVPGGTIRPGEEFEVWGADFGPFATVELFFSTGEQVGQIEAGADGHFTTVVRAPDELQTGFAELNATTNDGLWSSVWVEVSNSGTAAQQADLWTDPSVIVLGLFVIGAAALVGYVLLRGRRVTAPAPAPSARRPLPSKRRRARAGERTSVSLD